MLLNLALELVESLNKQETPSLVTSFERVVAIESQRISQRLFEDVVKRINENCDEKLMPYEEELIDEMQQEIVDFSN